MRYSEITSAPPHQRLAATIQQSAAAKGIQMGFPTAVQRAAMPYIVDCDGLTRTNLVAPGEFERESHARRQWCEAHAPGAHMIEPIGPNPEQLTGRRFRFADEKVAAMFKMSFPTDLWP